MTEAADAPTVEEYAALYPPQKPSLAETFRQQPELLDDVDRLRTEFGLTWAQITNYLSLHGVETAESLDFFANLAALGAA